MFYAVYILSWSAKYHFWELFEFGHSGLQWWGVIEDLKYVHGIWWKYVHNIVAMLGVLHPVMMTMVSEEVRRKKSE